MNRHFSILSALHRLALTLALALSAAAAEPAPAWKVPAQASLAGQATVEIELATPERTRVEWPAPGDKLGDFWVVSEQHPEPVLQPDGKLLWKRILLLDPPGKPGRYSLPETTLFLVAADGRKQPLSIPASAPIQVVSVLPAGQAGSPFEELKTAPRRLPPHLLALLKTYGLPALLSLALAGLGWWLWRRFGRRLQIPAAAPEAPPPPPHVVALAALEKLLASGWIEAGRIKEFHLELSFILRRYIEARFGVAAPESTTEEFLAGIRDRPEFAGGRRLALKGFLDHCDLVKFAEHQPARTQIDEAVACCRQFIAETVPAPEPPPLPPAAQEGR